MAVLTLCGGLLISLSVFPQEVWSSSQELIESQANGAINWSSGTLLARGLGFPPSSGSPSAATAMAVRAAKAVALRNLLELVQGIRVDSTTTVKNYVVESDDIQTRVNGLVKNAQEKERMVYPDGSVEVTVSMEMWGDHSLLSSLSTSNESNSSSGLDHEVQNAMEYSGVVLDARGVGLNPAAFPSLLDPKRQAILSNKEVEQLKGQSQGGAQYFTLNESLPLSRVWSRHPIVNKKATGPLMKRIGPRPLTIKGLGKAGAFQADIIVSAKDAKKLREDENLLKILQNGRIIIVTDPLIGGVEGSLPRSSMIFARATGSYFLRTLSIEPIGLSFIK